MLIEQNKIENKLKAFKQKHYFSLLLKGSLTTLLILSILFISGSLLEYTLWMNSLLRGLLLFIIFSILLYLAFQNIIKPILFLLKTKEGISDEEAAISLGKYFPNMKDELLNFIQLKNIKGNNELIKASLQQRENKFISLRFSSAINLKYSLQPAKYLILSIAFILLVSMWKPDLFLTSSQRILRFQENFAPVAPFNFILLNNHLQSFENEDYLLQVKLTGASFPADLYIVLAGRKIKMRSTNVQQFEHTFEKLKSSTSFYLEGAGFRSKEYTLNVVSRPSLLNFNVLLEYPIYLKKARTSLSNTGNILVPEGTKVSWELKTNNTDKVVFHFLQDSSEETTQTSNNQLVKLEKVIRQTLDYTIGLENEFGKNRELLNYKINMIKDEYPKISLNTFQDTTLFSFINFGGNITDDYGITSLKLFYSTDNSKTFKSINIPVDINQTQQGYFYNWQFDSTLLKNNKKLNYYLQVWDNDGMNGRKSTKTSVYTFTIPTSKEIKNKITQAQNKEEKDFNQSIKEAQELKERLNEAEQRLKGKKELTWQDENLIRDIIAKKEELNKAIEKLKEENKLNQLQQKRFSEENKRIQEKAEKLQELMDELLDEETKKLYDELKKLLSEQKDMDQVQDLMKQLNNREKNLEKELERTLELFKKMKFEYEINEKVNELKELSEKQEQLSEENDNKNADNEDLINQQEIIEEEMKDIKEELNELEKLGEELKNPKDLPEQEALFEEIQKALNESKENLEKRKNNKAKESQKDAGKKMKQAAEELEQMMGGMEMMMQQENMDDLRDIVHNLLKLSFDQEDIMNAFKDVEQSDPRFVELSQQQIQLKENSVIVNDSLEALAKRVFQIQSFVTRELNDMNTYMDASALAIKERKKNDIITKQQFAMTSMNNLALLLDDVLQQMQQQMADAMGQSKPGQNQKNQPGLSELQQQLNQKIEELKKSGKSGRELSEELAQMAAEQEKIRKSLEKAQEKFNDDKNGESPGNGIAEKMQETEIDLVNKEITDQTIKRQREILSRLLQAEDALREREQDEERESETAKQLENVVPKVFEEYFKMKEKEIELLKTVPPKLYPYYKNEVNQYFKRIGDTL